MNRLPAVLVFVGLLLHGFCAFAEPIVVGSKKFTESVVLGELTRLGIEDRGGEAIHRDQLGGTRVLWSALQRGDIDVYPEYTGTIAEEIFSGELSAADLETMRARLRESGIGMSAPLGFENTYAIGLLSSRADELDLHTISDLASHPELRFGLGNEFLDRDDGWRALRDAYDLPQRKVQGLDHDLAYKGLEAGDIDAMDVYTTDAEIPYYDIRTLVDDRGHFPTYDAVFLYRVESWDQHEELRETITGLEGAIDETAMQRMNRAVKIDGRSETAVAADFLDLDVAEQSSGLWSRLARRTVEHLEMVAISLGAAILLAIPLGIVAFRRPRFGQVILAVVGVLQTMPSLALLVLMIPLLGIGTTPAIFALFLYSLLPIVRNTHAGFAEIDPALRRAARGLGLTRGQILRHVEIPLTLRSVLAGVKTAAVINVGTATLGALIGAGGYGQPILTGIRLDDMSLVLEGAVPAALLALLVQWSFDGLELLIVSPGLRLDSGH